MAEYLHNSLQTRSSTPCGERDQLCSSELSSIVQFKALVNLHFVSDQNLPVFSLIFPFFIEWDAPCSNSTCSSLMFSKYFIIVVQQQRQLLGWNSRHYCFHFINQLTDSQEFLWLFQNFRVAKLWPRPRSSNAHHALATIWLFKES